VTHKLLLADDSVTIQRVVELTFSGEDVQVITVGDGEQAIARIPIERPDIVLADIGMPKRSGYDVSAFVKGRPDLAHIPVLLLAGAFEPVDDARAQQVKCDGVLVKPFEPQQVVSRVRELVDGVHRDKDRAMKVLAMPAPHAMAAFQTEAPAAPRRMLRCRTATKVRVEAGRLLSGLDAALAGLDGKADSRSAPPESDDFRASEVPTLEKLLGSTPLRDAGPGDVPFSTAGIGGSVLNGLTGHARTAEPAPAAPPGDGGNVILDAFNAAARDGAGRAETAARRIAVPPVPSSLPMNSWMKSLVA
jgi:CheY-like chemotaxis protein